MSKAREVWLAMRALYSFDTEDNKVIFSDKYSIEYDKNKEYENYLIIDNVLFFNKGKATGACNSISVP